MVTDIPRRTVTRTAKLATLPLGMAGRATVGIGRRLGGRPAEIVAAELQQRTAEQVFRVLGELKGGAMKLGQALSVFEAALPEDVASPYRAALTRLQEAAPALPAAQVHGMLRGALGQEWRDAFTAFDDNPAAAASIGQVHRATWADGRDVAVKVQYPGAGPALLNDLTQLARAARLFAVLSPGLDIKPLIAEMKARVAEELDYAQEGEAQRAFAAAYAGDPHIVVPRVVAVAPGVIVTEWLDGTPLSEVIRDGAQDQRDQAGALLARFLFGSPGRVGLLHADPHPGNFRLLSDGRLGVLDFGAVARVPAGMPPGLGAITRAVAARDAELVEALFRREGFLRDEVEIQPGQVLDYVAPLLAPVVEPEFTFSRDWLRRQAVRIGNPRGDMGRLGRQLNLPPEYLLINRVATGTTGVLCQLGATARYRALAEELLPDYVPPRPRARGARAARRPA